MLNTKQSMFSTRVKKEITHNGGKEFCKGYRTPNHCQHHAEKPFPKVYGIDFHQF